MAATAPAIEHQPPLPAEQASAGNVATFGILTLLSLALGLVAPFFAYVFLDRAGLDVSAVAYGIILAVLVLTFLLICLQGLMPGRAMRATTSIGAPFIFDHRLVVLGNGPGSGRSPGSLWTERLRAEMQWLLRHSPRQDAPETGLYRFSLYLWRPMYVWIVLQTLPLLAFWVWRHGDPAHPLTSLRSWLPPMIVLAAVYLLHSAPVQTIFAYALAAPSGRRHAGWFLADMLWSIAFAGAWRNTIARVAQLRLFLGRKPSGAPEPPREELPAEAPPAPLPAAAIPKTEPAEAPTAAEEEEPAAIEPPAPAIDTDAQTAAAPPPTIIEEPAITKQPAPPDVAPSVPTQQQPTFREPGTTNNDQRRPEGTRTNEQRQSAIHAANELATLVEALAEQLADRAQESARLAARVDELESALGSRQALSQDLAGTPAAQISSDELRSMQRNLDALLQDSTNLIALAELSRQSGQLAEVVRAYTLFREQE